jgi:hypothetical protein
MAKEAGLFESMALGGIAASFAVNFTHPIVRIQRCRACSSMMESIVSVIARSISAFFCWLMSCQNFASPFFDDSQSSANNNNISLILHLSLSLSLFLSTPPLRCCCETTGSLPNM